MSIVHRSHEALILDHGRWIQEVYFSSMLSPDTENRSHQQYEGYLPVDAVCTARGLPAKRGVDVEHKEKENTRNSERVTHDVARPLIMRLFDIRTPFLMDGAAVKRAAYLEEQGGCSLPPEGGQTLCGLPAGGVEAEASLPASKTALGTLGLSKAGAHRRRKKVGRMNKSRESEARSDEATEVSSVMERFSTVAGTPEYRKIFSYSPTPEDFRNNNRALREVAARILDDTAHTSPDVGRSVTSGHNNGNACRTIEAEGNKFILPSRCSYYQTDVRNMATTLPKNSKFKVVVMDPPWWNKHVKRAKKSKGGHHGYEMMSVPELLDMPIRHLLMPDSVVLVWATNNRAILSHFTNQVEQRWSLQLRRTIFWMKVTLEGVPITAYHECVAGKLPFERLLVLEYFEKLLRPPCSWSNIDAICSSRGARSVEKYDPDSHTPNDGIKTSSCDYRESDQMFESFPNGSQIIDMNDEKSMKRKSCPQEENYTEDGGSQDDICCTTDEGSITHDNVFLLVSTPSALHSHKPPLNEVARELGYAGSDDFCLEVFARSLVPGWASLGLEVLRLQKACLYGSQIAPL